ncbi:MAG: ATP-binding cassette domain-containing protein [Dehalococcoidia bacterium]
MTVTPRGIRVTEISFTPPGAARAALTDLSLQLAPGEFVAVLGHNGSGKSTLARHLNGLIRPQAGSVAVDELDTAIAADLPAIRRRVGLIFQNPDHQIVGATVDEDVAWGMPGGLEPAAARRRISETLCAVGLEGYESHATWRLSGGQKQRLALAGVLAREPAYLVCDEVTALLDGRTREEVRDVLLGCRDRGLGLLWITHRLEEAMLADRLVILRGGSIVATGTPHDLIWTRPELMASLPPLAGVARQLRAAGLEVDELPRSAEHLARQIAALLESVESRGTAAPATRLPAEMAG